jgi:transketolase
MAAISNGLFAHGGFRPFCATFLNFAGYAMGSIRVSALSKFGVIYVMTHDSIGLGEDGPTHQPIEMLDCLRSIPNLLTLRPADGHETVGAYEVAFEQISTPSVICLSRQATPSITGTDRSKVKLGAYVVSEFATDRQLPDLILVSTGTELSITIKIAASIHNEGYFIRYFLVYNKIYYPIIYFNIYIKIYFVGLFPCLVVSYLISKVLIIN